MYFDSENSDFQGENLQDENFRDRLLKNAKFQGANLKRANFQYSNLQGAEFQGADLKDTNFQSADIYEANFKGAKLHGANLRECRNIETANWKKAEYDNTTRFPVDFAPNNFGLIRTSRRIKSNPKEFKPQIINEMDAKIKVTLIELQKSIQKRRGQKKFRDKLIEVYQGRCAITGCAVEEVLEAAHVKPYHLSQENKSENGILLRADFHTLFDLNLIIINPLTKKIEVNKQLHSSRYYNNFNNQVLLAYRKNIYLPDKHYLEWRYHNYEGYLNNL